MLLLELDLDGEPHIQGFVRTQWPTAGIGHQRESSWAQLFQRSAGLWNQFDMRSVAVRVESIVGEPLTSLHAFVAPKAQEARLRLALAALLRTHGMADSIAETLRSESDFDGRYLHVQEARLGLGHELLQTNGGVRINFNLRLFDYLPQIIRVASDLGLSFAYEAQAVVWAPPRELLRSILINLADLKQQRAAPAELLHNQRDLAERLKRSAYHVEESLACVSSEQANALSQIIGNLLSDTVYARLGARPTFELLDETRADAFGHHIHSSLMSGQLHADAGTAGATKEEVDARMGMRILMRREDCSTFIDWSGSDPLFATLTGPRRPRAPTGGGVAAQTSGGPYLFISYARMDAQDVYPLVNALAHQRVSTWIDRSIPGGEEWPAAIEEQIIECSGVLALVSPAFVDSHYCPREVIFADALHKPIVPVFIRPAQLKRGLAWLLTAHNQISASDFTLILTAVRQHAPQTIH